MYRAGIFRKTDAEGSDTLSEARVLILDGSIFPDLYRPTDHWRVLIDEGEDPKDHDAQKKRESQRKREDSFEAVVETYAKRRAVEAAPRRRGEA